jgi:hypothetical protein
MAEQGSLVPSAADLRINQHPHKVILGTLGESSPEIRARVATTGAKRESWNVPGRPSGIRKTDQPNAPEHRSSKWTQLRMRTGPVPAQHLTSSDRVTGGEIAHGRLSQSDGWFGPKARPSGTKRDSMQTTSVKAMTTANSRDPEPSRRDIWDQPMLVCQF